MTKKFSQYFQYALNYQFIIQNYSLKMNVESITITVEPEHKNLSKININPISKCMDDIKSIHGDFMFSSLDPDQKIIIEHKTHPVFEGFVSAYR